MTAAERIRKCIVLEKINQYPEYSKKLGHVDKSQLKTKKGGGHIEGNG